MDAYFQTTTWTVNVRCQQHNAKACFVQWHVQKHLPGRTAACQEEFSDVTGTLRTMAAATQAAVCTPCQGNVGVVYSIRGPHLPQAADALVGASAAGVADVLPAGVGGYEPIRAQRLKQLTLRHVVQATMCFSQHLHDAEVLLDHRKRLKHEHPCQLVRSLCS